MNGDSAQIVTAYEVNGLSVEEIAESLDYESTTVKSILAQYSSKFRQDIKEEPSLDYNLNEQEEAKRAILSLMRNTEDEYLKARLALKIRDDGKGRLDVGVSIVKSLNASAGLFNAHLLEARMAKERSKMKELPKPTEPVLEAEVLSVSK